MAVENYGGLLPKTVLEEQTPTIGCFVYSKSARIKISHESSYLSYLSTTKALCYIVEHCLYYSVSVLFKAQCHYSKVGLYPQSPNASVYRI